MKIIEPRVEVEEFDGIQIMKNIERACRTCYRSEDKISDESYKSLLKNCLNRGHQSILEHEKISIRMICDIGVYKDLTRHRIASFSIESTRYCCYDKEKFDGAITFIKPLFWDDWTVTTVRGGRNNFILFDRVDYIKRDIWLNSMQRIEENYMLMRENNATPDECRMLLPHSTAAEVVMTANIREWRHILGLRCSKATHPSVQQVMIPLLLHFKYHMPELFMDIEFNEDFDPNYYAGVNVI